MKEKLEAEEEFSQKVTHTQTHRPTHTHTD